MEMNEQPVTPPVTQPKGKWMGNFWDYFIAIQNAPPGTLLAVGIDDPTPYLKAPKPPASAVGLPEGFI